MSAAAPLASTRQPSTDNKMLSAPASLAVYLRVSSDEQREAGTIDTQRGAAERYCALHDLAPNWYADDGVSGTVPFAQRPEGARLLADAQAGHIKTLVCWRLDRMGRNALAVLQAVETLERAGVRLVSITESFDTSTPAGRLQLNMLATIAEFERDSIVQRTTEGIRRKLREGAWMGGQVPYGYQVVNQRLTAHPSTSPIVRRAYALCAAGWTTQRIADHFQAERIPPPGQARTHAEPLWRAGRVDAMLRSTVYRGQFTYGKRTKGPLTLVEVEAIVSPEEWEAAQAMLTRHQHDQVHANHRDYLLSGLMRCGVCGRLYGGAWYKIGHREPCDGARYYVCNAKRYASRYFGNASADEHRCASTALRAEWVEGEVWGDVEQWIRDPGVALDLLTQQMRGTADQSEALRADLTGVQQQLDAKQAERDKVVGAYRRGLITERDLTRDLDALAGEEADLTAKMQHLQRVAQDARAVEASLSTAATLLRRLHDQMDTGTISQREAVEALVSSIVVNMEPAGTSRRGRPILRPRVVVTYLFDAPHQTRDLSCAASHAASAGRRRR